ncbi:MAG: hypothetical protein FLDDKLPJ_01759 [Phycisphaerae bacterium]|nr:hypothetical protein [Phycisphaerae bacterium]
MQTAMPRRLRGQGVHQTSPSTFPDGRAPAREHGCESTGRSDSGGGTADDFAPGAVRPEANPIPLLVQLLHQLVEILSGAGDADYVLKPVGGVSGSLGAHVRHCLDHIDALLTGAARGVIDYDDRRRGTVVETRRAAAFDAILDLEGRLRRLDASMLTHAVRVRTVIGADGMSLEAMSSFSRELAFVLSHTVHHHALMGAMCATLGIPVPEGFGYAPSTLAYRASSLCVPSR